MSTTVSLNPDRSQSAALARRLRHLILDGKFSPQEALPAQRELSSRFQVGIQIVRSALAMLEDEGLVYKRQRQGSFIRLDRVNAPSPVTSRSQLRCINFLERPNGTSPGYVRTGYLQGYSEALESVDVKMRFVHCPAGDDRWESIFSPSFSFQEQGCVLINVVSAPLMQWLIDHQIPFVVQSNRAYATSEFPPHHSVSINKVRGGFEAARHLVELGHKRIGFIGPVPSRDVWDNDVYGGCLAGIALGGQHLRTADVLDFATNEPAMAREPARRYLDRADRPTAIVAHNDVMALAVIDAAHEMGLRVPDDLSVVGFDDVPEAETCDPPLTTFANPRVMLGRTVVQTLLSIAAGDPPTPESLVIEGQLNVRSSTAPPPMDR